MSDTTMEPIRIFHDRLAKIGINVEFVGNYPWVYLDKVNGRKVHGRYLGNHGFTAFWVPVMRDQPTHISDIGVVFKKIREVLCDQQDLIKDFEEEYYDY